MDENKKHNSEAEKRIIHDVEKYGFHKALLEDDGYLPAFIYSIGLYKTYQHPEIIIFGLKTDVMNHLLHSLAEEIKKGVKFKAGIDYNGIISNYPIRFIEVDKEHYPDYLGYCGWFYNRTFDFPTYQLVWTDKDGNYPWDEIFFKDWKFRQPLLDRNTDFKFYEERNLGVFTTSNVLNGEPIKFVYHNEDGDWQFHSEQDPDLTKAKLVSLEELVKMDRSLNEIYYLNYGESAERMKIGDNWKISGNNE